MSSGPPIAVSRPLLSVIRLCERAAHLDGQRREPDTRGTPHPEFQKNTLSRIQSAAFVGPAGVGAMGMSGASYQTFLDQTYSAIATRQLVVGGLYYDSSWTVLSLLMMTANFLDYTAY
ncbi:MAG: hypothetical protein ABIW57_12935 [Polyangia bacterium]